MLKNIFLITLLFLGSIFAHISEASASQKPLLIAVGDQITVSVYNEPDLTVQVRVDDSGRVSFPLLGEVKVLQFTPKQLSTHLEKKLLDGFLVDPLVTVLIQQYRPYYIRGEVTKPGAYEYSVDITVSQAIAVAGGLKDRASRSNWLLLRETEDKEIDADKDTKLSPGDVLTIKASIF